KACRPRKSETAFTSHRGVEAVLFIAWPRGRRTLPLAVFELDAGVEPCDDHAFADFEATGERGLVIAIRLIGVSVPELAVGAVAVPTEVAVRDRAHREEL